jgi:hypothetical protein
LIVALEVCLKSFAWSLVLLVLLVSCGEVVPVSPDAPGDPCTGTCECRVDTDCAAHAVCDDQVTSRVCTCAAGYTRSAGGACEWSGVIRDPGFSSATMWTIDGAATIDGNLNQAGMVDPGAAHWAPGDALCKMSRITQSVMMPRYSRAQPLVAQVSFRFSGRFDFIVPSVGFGTAFSDALQASAGPWRTARLCLGGGQYAPESSTGAGVQMPLTLMANRLGFECATIDVMDIDRVEVVPANPRECPAPGEAANGDAEGPAGWTFNVTGSSTGTFAAGAGEAGTRGARLYVHLRCESANALEPISIPVSSAVPSPALSFFHRATNLSTTFVSLGGVTLPALGGTGGGVTHRLCIPPYMRGAVFNLQASMNTGSGSCADVVGLETVFDSVKIVNEPSCGTDATMADPGFESPLGLVGATSTPGKSIARALNDPSLAHAGSGVLQLSETSTCNDPTWVANIITPSVSGTAGPALSFFYRADPGVTTLFGVSSGFGPPFTPTQDGAWHQGLVCLNPVLRGRNQNVHFSVRFQSGTCEQVIAAETAYVDDLVVTTDASCPAM